MVLCYTRSFLFFITLKTILSIYSDSNFGYAALQSGKTIFKKQIPWRDRGAQSSMLVPFIKEIVEDSNFQEKIETIIAPKGPASFTTLRVILTIARFLEFSYNRIDCNSTFDQTKNAFSKNVDKNIEIFSPSQFHVLAFSAKNDLDRNKNFWVLIDSFASGFYLAQFSWKFDKERPLIINTPLFLKKEQTVDFLKTNKNDLIITNFLEESPNYELIKSSKSKILYPIQNFALTQLELYSAKPNIEDNFPYNNLSTYYLYNPEYAKINDTSSDSSKNL